MAGSSEDLPRFCYSGGSYGGGNQHPPPHISGHHMHNFESNAAIYNLTAGMEMIGFPPKNLHQTAEASSSAAAYLWKSAVHGGGNHPSSAKEMGGDYYHTDWHNPQDWHPTNPNRSSYLVDDDDSSLRCVFPCEPNERPSQGLSLSLSSSNPSAIVLQSFELRQHGDTRFGPSSSKPPSSSSQVIVGHEQQQQSILRSSKYLVPAQELLKEFCNLGTKQTQKKSREYNQEDESAIKTQSLYTLDLIELQRRKAKLLQLLEEVDRRYKHYCHQMLCVVSSFESIAGHGSATVYLSMASKAMSRHFRCLRDGIERQMRATKKAMGEMDASAPGTMKGETPRLRLIDQTLRQQRAMQNMSVMESHPWRPQRGLPERAVSILRAWLFEHFLHPYPCDVDKHILARQTGLSRSQVSNWFINARVRLWKPMVEEMYLEELKGGEDAAMGDGDLGENIQRNEDEKPGHDQLLRMDSECLSSIINNNNAEKNEMKRNKAIQNEQQRSSSGFINSYGGGGGGGSHDFSSYGAAGDAVSYGVGSGVSLTLGLHQHGGDMNSLFYGGREQMEECQTGGGQYSLLDGENQNLPYRNLMGAQLLHDLAG